MSWGGAVAVEWLLELLLASFLGRPMLDGRCEVERAGAAGGLRKVSMASMQRAASWVSMPRSSTSAVDMLQGGGGVGGGREEGLHVT
jgi:hypothetical protein